MGEYFTFYESIKDKVNFIKGTVLRYNDWEKESNGADEVVHLAVETGAGQSVYEIERYTNVNTKGTSIFFDILINEKHSVKR